MKRTVESVIKRLFTNEKDSGKCYKKVVYE